MAISRRMLLRLGAMGLGGSAAHLPAIAAGSAAATDPEELIVRSRRPLNLESTTTALDHRLTPNDAFFVRSHFGAPAVDLSPWEVELVGLVDRPLRLTIDAMGRLEQASKAAVLQCAGNGRALYRPRVPGVPWERGAVGQAEWAGVRLAELLDRAGVQPGAAHLHFLGGDAPPNPRIAAFVRSIPIDRGRDPRTILALRMNGEALPVIHGGPIRLVVPGWAGNNWFKWVRRIVVARDEAPGFYMQTAYRMPRTPVRSGAPPGAVPADPVTWMNVKSLISSPGRGDVMAAGPVELRGIAWTGQGHVNKVEVRIEDRWRSATVLGDPEPGAWRQWRLRWEPSRPGQHVVVARATDSMGQVQPESPPWNKSGYLWNGFDSVEFAVR
jgi:DMSO/TMAO reductase YedYZ molybdopterin-dependent catalytic subunit